MPGTTPRAQNNSVETRAVTICSSTSQILHQPLRLSPQLHCKPGKGELNTGYAVSHRNLIVQMVVLYVHLPLLYCVSSQMASFTAYHVILYHFI